MMAPWAVLVHELIFTPQVLQPLQSRGLQWQQHFISRHLRARLYKCTGTRTKVSSKQLLRFKSTLIPSASLARVGTLQQGSACCGREPCARTSLLRRPVVETVYRKGKCSVGSLRYQWKCILRATAGSRGAFLYLPLLIPSARERRCQRNTHQEYFQERMAKTITILFQKMFKSRQSTGQTYGKEAVRSTTEPVWWSPLRRTRKFCWPPISHDPTATRINHRLNLWLSSCLLHKNIIIFAHTETKFETPDELLFRWRARKTI